MKKLAGFYCRSSFDCLLMGVSAINWSSCFYPHPPLPCNRKILHITSRLKLMSCRRQSRVTVPSMVWGFHTRCRSGRISASVLA